MARGLNTSRFGRAAKLGGLAGGAAARTLGVKAANVVRSDEDAAASIGQVYRATLRDGGDGAVKVQHPGTNAVVRTDLKNVKLVLRVAARDRTGEILFFYVNGPYRTRLLNGDPHPGNAPFLDDGGVAFLDFGLLRRQTHEEAGTRREVLRAVYAPDTELGREEAAWLRGEATAVPVA